MRSLVMMTALIAMLGSGCGSTTGNRAGAGSRETVGPVLGVIIAQTRAEDMFGELGIDAPSGFWTPERGQVAALEAAIPPYLESAAPEGSRLRRGLRGYRAQYIGILRGDREVVFANFFCDDFGRDIDLQMIVVDDGGDCFFTVEFDPADESFDQLSINGES